jgi:hypothetical protein
MCHLFCRNLIHEHRRLAKPTYFQGAFIPTVIAIVEYGEF